MMIDLQDVIEINLIILVFALVYFIAKRWMSYRAARLTLLALPILAIASVLIKFAQPASKVINVPLVELEPIAINGAVQETSSYVGWQIIIVLGMMLSTGYLLFKVGRLLFYFRKAIPYVHNPSIKILVSERKDSFSFFNFIHLSDQLDEEERQVILEHEMLHAEKFHSLDLILMELYQAIFWYNPVIILMKREMVQIHEYEVDHDLYEKYNAKYLTHLLSYSLGTSVAHLLLTSQFYPKMTLANRIKKMKTKKRNRRFGMLMIPVLAMGFILTSWTYSSEQFPATSDFTPAHDITEGDIDKSPQFKGGQEAMIAFMQENVKYPKEAEKKGIEGTVYVQFNVEASGKISDIKVTKGVHKLLDAEAKRVVGVMPDWEPGIKDGKAVKTQMTLPIKFQL